MRTGLTLHVDPHNPLSFGLPCDAQRIARDRKAARKHRNYREQRIEQARCGKGNRNGIVEEGKNQVLPDGFGRKGREVQGVKEHERDRRP